MAQQLYNRFEAAGKPLKAGDIAIVDAAEYHYYQVRIHRMMLFSFPLLTQNAIPSHSLDGTYHHLPFPLLIPPDT